MQKEDGAKDFLPDEQSADKVSDVVPCQKAEETSSVPGLFPGEFCSSDCLQRVEV